MKNKIILSILSMVLTILTAQASDKVHVAAIEEFSTNNPPKTVDVRVVDTSTMGHYILKKDDILHCNVIEVTNAKRGKRAASFTVCPTSFTSEGQTTKIDENYYGKYSAKVFSKEELKNIDKMQVGKKAAVTVGNHFMKGVAPAVSLAEGIIKNEDGHPLQSGIKQVYKDSPLSYVEKGKELDLTSNDEFYLIFKSSKSKDVNNVEGEALDEDSEEN